MEAVLVRAGGAAAAVLQVPAGVRAAVAVPRLPQHGAGVVRAARRAHGRRRRARGRAARPGGGAALARRLAARQGQGLPGAVAAGAAGLDGVVLGDVPGEGPRQGQQGPGPRPRPRQGAGPAALPLPVRRQPQQGGPGSRSREYP